MNSQERICLWKKYEEVAMHFNELLIRLRTQALGGVATIVTVAGFLAGRKETEEPWTVVSAVSLLLLLAWCTLWMIDVCYYSRLLRGAVNGLLKIERESEGLIYFSTEIEARFGPPDEHSTRASWQARVFYVPIAAFLLCVTIFSLCKAIR